ncbi:hypothetical protein [Georgenia sp. EYE_87]|uniref:hypothetical protein n=1 Tax=Georgenia sp. EYE_87 TaxID=2853448 RepID=UPI002004EC25|nr:hypothetical protein [Georgenia sp. EYE_87]
MRRLLNIGGQLTPRASDRLLVGPPEQWVEQLAALTLEHGVSGYILMGDDPGTLAVLGQEVAPAVRELVAAERGTAGHGTAGRGTAAAPAPVSLRPRG